MTTSCAPEGVSLKLYEFILSYKKALSVKKQILNNPGLYIRHTSRFSLTAQLLVPISSRVSPGLHCVIPEQ